MSESNFKVFALFFIAGSQWMRGLSDRETAKKVKAYLELFQRVSDMESFTSDLFTCSIQMLHISWKPEDVGSLPPYLIETKTVIQPERQWGANLDQMKEY